MSSTSAINVKSLLPTVMSYIFTELPEAINLGITSYTKVLSKWSRRHLPMEHNETQSWKTVAVSYIGSSIQGQVVLPVKTKDDSILLSSQPLLDQPLLNYSSNITSSHDANSTETFVNITDSSFTTSSETSSFVPPPMLIIFLLIAPLICVLLWGRLKSWWLYINLRTAEDPSSDISHLPLPPGDFGLPIIGETFAWLSQGAKFNSSRRKKYGNVFKTNTIGSQMVRVSGHQFVGEVLRGEHDKVTSIWPINVRKILGENVLVNSLGAAHRMKRKFTCKAFSRSALDGYIPTLLENARRNIQEMTKCERPLVYNKMLRLTFDLAATTLLGLDTSQSRCNVIVDAFYNLVSNIFSVPLRIPGFGFSKAMNARAQLLNLLQDHIQHKKSTLMKEFGEDNINAEGKENVAFDIIIRELLYDKLKNKKQDSDNNLNNNNTTPKVKEEEEPISDFALKEMAMELMFAGYFTSGSALTSLILELSRNPHVFKKVEEELFQHGLLKDSDSPDEGDVEINLKVIQSLTYLEQVLKETLRIRPPVLGGYRKARRTFQIGDYRVPKGWYVIYNIRDTHEFEFEDMDTFDPERFAPNNEDLPKFKFVAFGGGPRMCIGREFARLTIKLTMIEMFRTYRSWELANKKLPKMKAIPTLHPADGLPCHFYPRKKFGVISR